MLTYPLDKQQNIQNARYSDSETCPSTDNINKQKPQPPSLNSTQFLNPCNGLNNTQISTDN